MSGLPTDSDEADAEERQPRRSSSLIWSSLDGLRKLFRRRHPREVPPVDENDPDDGYPETTLGTLGEGSASPPSSSPSRPGRSSALRAYH